jgi:hypothetical protein
MARLAAASFRQAGQFQQRKHLIAQHESVAE